MSMTKEEQRVALATALGWKNIHLVELSGMRFLVGTDPKGHTERAVPGWPSDMDAVNEVEHSLSDREFAVYTDKLVHAFNGCVGSAIRARASIRVEVLLNTLEARCTK